MPWGIAGGAGNGMRWNYVLALSDDIDEPHKWVLGVGQPGWLALRAQRDIIEPWWRGLVVDLSAISNCVPEVVTRIDLVEVCLREMHGQGSGALTQ